MSFRGAGVAIVTPFNEDFTVNFHKLKELIDFQIDNGTDAIIICGTTGEASTLTDEEQIECIKKAVEFTDKRVPVYAGAGSNHTEHAVELAVSSQEVGASGVLLVTPYYNKTNQKGLELHYKSVANSIDIPVLLYNVPSRTGLNIAPKTCYELSKIKNIIGIKEASGNFSNIVEIASLCGPDFKLYSGNDDQVLPILSLGGSGVISVLSNVAPKVMHDMVISFLDGDINTAIKLQTSVIPMVKAIFSDVNPIPVKEALNLMGYGVGDCKMPLYKMDDDLIVNLKNAMKQFDLIK